MCLYRSFLEKRWPSGFETTLLKLVRDALLLWQPDAVAKVQENWDGWILLYLAKQVASMPHSCLVVTDENKIEENQWKITHPQKKKSSWDSSSGRVWIEDSNFQELGCHRMHSAFLRRKSLLVWSFGVSGCLRFLNIPRGHTMDVEIIYQSMGVYHDVTFCGQSRSKDVHGSKQG